MATIMESTTKAIREHAGAALKAVEENGRNVRRGVVVGRHAVEDFAAETTLRVRRHPFIAVGLAVGVGSLVGCVAAFALCRRGRSRLSK